jgi:hypothetical protein
MIESAEAKSLSRSPRTMTSGRWEASGDTVSVMVAPSSGFIGDPSLAGGHALGRHRQVELLGHLHARLGVTGQLSSHRMLRGLGRMGPGGNQSTEAGRVQVPGHRRQHRHGGTGGGHVRGGEHLRLAQVLTAPPRAVNR